MSGVRGWNWPRALRFAIAMFLVFSCTRVTRPLHIGTSNPSAQMASDCPQVTRGTVLEVGAEFVKLPRPKIIRSNDTFLALATDTDSSRDIGQRPAIQIWPEQKRAFLRRILSPAPDPSH
jgi:hypothetical protein